MIPKECNIIGKGGHWVVERIIMNDNGQRVSVIRKHGKPGKADENIVAFNLVSKAGLPTLSRYVRISDSVIEAEDLNADITNGYFVSPNTVRSCDDCGSLLIKVMSNKQLTETESEVFYRCGLDEIFYMIKEKGAGALSDEIVEELRSKKVLPGAEGELYYNKVAHITNLDSFWVKAKVDMIKAADTGIELYPDAFFFRVNPNDGEIEYRIADFDCIRDVSRYKNCYTELVNANIEHIKTSFEEYVIFFVVKEKQEDYKKQIRGFS